MTVRVDEEGVIRLEDVCGVEDAEHLLTVLLQQPAAAVDVTACEGAHTAVVQVLLAARATVRGPAKAAFLSRWIEPLLE